MGTALISNPPYNMKWSLPPFAQLQPRFNDCELPPESNANYAFILTALSMIDDKAVLLLPCGVLESKIKQEVEIRKYLVEKNLIEAIITCPNNMFESTGIATCIIVFNKHKNTANIELIDMRNTFSKEIREQRGQFGGKRHTNRVYKKEINIFTEEQMKKAILAIENKANEKDFSVCASIQQIKEHNYNLLPSAYFEIDFNDVQLHREYAEIIDDLNRVIKEKNGLKLTMNESLAKAIGLYDIFLMFKQSEETNCTMNEMLSFIGKKIEKENFISISKKAGELKFENGNKDNVSTILMSILQMWKQHIMYLNNEENRYLAELRDALLPDLMSGKIDLSLDEKEDKN